MSRQQDRRVNELKEIDAGKISRRNGAKKATLARKQKLSGDRGSLRLSKRRL